MTTFTNFLKNASTKGTNLAPTHTRIGSDNGIYGGAYHITPEMKPEFNQLYYKKIFKNSEKEYLTEKQSAKCIALDFDFRYAKNVTERQHTDETIDDFIQIYLDEIKKIVQFEPDTEFDIFVMEKDEINSKHSEEYNKDGIHIIIGIQMMHETQMYLRDIILEKMNEIGEQLCPKLTNTWDKVLDDGISKGSTNWQVIGSQKPNNEPYKMTKHWHIKYDDRDRQFGMESNNIEMTPELFEKMSVQYEHNPVLSFTQDYLMAKKKQEKVKAKPVPKLSIDVTSPTSVTQIDTSTPIMLLLINGLGNKGHTHNQWVGITAWAIQHITFVEYMRFVDAEWHLNAERLWENLSKNPKPIPLQYLHKLVRERNYAYYLEWCSMHGAPLSLNILNKGGNDVAKAMENTLRVRMVYSASNKSWVEFDMKSHLWRFADAPDAKIVTAIQKEIDICISTLLFKKEKETDSDLINRYEKEHKQLLGHYTSVAKSSYVSQIKKFLQDYLRDDDFVAQLDTNKYTIAFKNGILDLKTRTFREGIQQSDMITSCLSYPYRTADANKRAIVRQMLLRICNNSEEDLAFYLSSLGYAMCRDGKREQLFWNFLGQTASNGKSIIFEILEEILPIYVMKATPDFLDKGVDNKKEIATWRGLCILWVNELSSGKKDAELVKSIGDATTIKYKKNYATYAENMPVTFKLFTVSNFTLNIKCDAGITRRLKICEFTSQFQESNEEDNDETRQYKCDPDLHNKLCNEYKYEMLDLIFEYSQKYYEDKKLKSYPAKWQKEKTEMVASCNEFEEWFCNNYTISAGECVSKQQFMAELSNAPKLKNMTMANIKDELKRMKSSVVYDSQKKIESTKGFLIGIKKNDYYENDGVC